MNKPNAIPGFSSLFAFVLFLFPCACVFALDRSAVEVVSLRDSSVYESGERVSWKIHVNDSGLSLGEFSCRVVAGSSDVLYSDQFHASDGDDRVIEVVADRPGMLRMEVSVMRSAEKMVLADNSVVVSPRSIRGSLVAPDDFHSFWEGKISELSRVPLGLCLKPQPSDREGVDYWQVEMDSIGGSRIHGQLARPVAGDKFPALVVFQWAGVYGLKKPFVTVDASNGWMVFNISAHDLPIDESDDYYKEQGGGRLRNYMSIGNDDREKSYFLRMFLSCVRAVDYVASRPDWNRKDLVVVGSSQGGFQALAVAGLRPELITCVMANVPAGCDHTAADAGRIAGWPGWINSGSGKDSRAVRETARYFDCVNFCERIKCPVLMSVALADTISRPDGVFSAANKITIQAPVEMVIMPGEAHQGRHLAYHRRVAAWKAAIFSGGAPPLIPW